MFSSHALSIVERVAVLGAREHGEILAASVDCTMQGGDSRAVCRTVRLSSTFRCFRHRSVWVQDELMDNTNASKQTSCVFQRTEQMCSHVAVSPRIQSLAVHIALMSPRLLTTRSREHSHVWWRVVWGVLKRLPFRVSLFFVWVSCKKNNSQIPDRFGKK